MRSSRPCPGSGFPALLVGLAMLAFGLLQLNDPDPLVWVSYHALAAGACTFAAYRPMPAVLFWPLAAATAAGLVLSFPGFLEWVLRQPTSDLWATMSAERMHIEHSREFLGLLIAGGLLATVYRHSRG